MKRVLLGLVVGVVLVLGGVGVLLYSPESEAKPVISFGWTPARLVTESIAPGDSVTYSVVMKNLGKSPIAPTNQLRIVAEGAIAPFIRVTQPVFPKGNLPSGGAVKFDVTVSVPEDAPVGVSDGTLVLQRVLPNGKIKEAWRAEGLPVNVEVVSLLPLRPSSRLPAPPDSVSAFEVTDSVGNVIVIQLIKSGVNGPTYTGMPRISEGWYRSLPDSTYYEHLFLTNGYLKVTLPYDYPSIYQGAKVRIYFTTPPKRIWLYDREMNVIKYHPFLIEDSESFVQIQLNLKNGELPPVALLAGDE